MNLQSNLDSRLWTAVERSYEDGNYSGAISDSFYFLSDLIRDKSGLDSDGAALIGAAFGGDAPVIRVNKLQTENDRSEQKGIEQILRGMYLGLRNPRSHEKREDAADTADAVISFINYLVALIDRSKSPFDIEQIIQKVFDKHFVPTAEYASALATRVPARKRFDVIAEVFNRRITGKIEHIGLFIRAMLDTMTSESQAAFWAAVSNALEEASSDAEFRTATYVAGPNWSSLTDLARLRTENRLIASIAEGEYNAETQTCPKGALGTWASGLTARFVSRSRLKEALVDRLATGQNDAIEYVLKYFRGDVFEYEAEPSWKLQQCLKSRLEADDERIFDAIWFLELNKSHKAWKKSLERPLADFKLRNPNAGAISDEDIPF